MAIRERIFRARLKEELPKLHADGLIDSGQARALRHHYGLDEDSTSLAASAIYVLGALLIGGGVISFVTWNWEALPRAAKVVLIYSAMLAAHGTGYWFWKMDGGKPRLGHSLTFLGTLIFGANIGLMSQIFHVSSNPYNGIGGWALGAGAAGWALRSIPNSVLAILLVAIWYPNSLAFPSWSATAIALGIGGGFMYLSWRDESKLLSFLTVTLVGPFILIASAGDEIPVVWMASAYVVVLLAASIAMSARQSWKRHASTTGFVGLSGYVIVAGLLSYGDAASGLSLNGSPYEADPWLFALPLLLLVAAGLLTSSGDRLSEHIREHATAAAAMATIVPVAASLLVQGLSFVTVILSNLSLIAVAVVAVATSLKSLDRSRFWFGILLAAGVIVARFFEFRVNLWIKAIGFVTCGVIVLIVGSQFERLMKGQEAND